VQKEQGSLRLFRGKGELLTAHEGIYKSEERKAWVCDHCKKKGHMKDKCWILHPHLKPAKLKANISQEVASDQGEVVRKSNLEALIRSIASLKESGTSFFTYEPSKTLKESDTSFFTSEPSKMLVIDSGASHHMINNPSLIDSIKLALGNVVIANADKVPVKGIGDLNLFDKKSKALFMPSFTLTLLSVKRATNDLNCYTIFGPSSVHFQDIKTRRVLGKGDAKGDLYVFEKTPLSDCTSVSLNSCLASNLNVAWHARLGHPHARAFILMLRNVSFDNSTCESCILGKHYKSIFPKSLTIYENCFDLVHSDVWTFPCISMDNKK